MPPEKRAICLPIIEHPEPNSCGAKEFHNGRDFCPLAEFCKKTSQMHMRMDRAHVVAREYKLRVRNETPEPNPSFTVECTRGTLPGSVCGTTSINFDPSRS
jgi:hypothetical protein